MAQTSIQINEEWKEALSEEFSKPYFQNLTSFIKQEKADNKTIYPAGSLIFNAYNTTPLNQVKVVILGQDPYHNPGQAMGLILQRTQRGHPTTELTQYLQGIKYQFRHPYLKEWRPNQVGGAGCVLT